MAIEISSTFQKLPYTLKNDDIVVPGENNVSGNIDANKPLTSCTLNAVISSYAEKNGVGKTAALPVLAMPSAVADRLQLNASLKGITETNQHLPADQVQTVLRNSVETQVTRLVQEIESSKETAALTASEAGIIASFNSIIGRNDTAVYGSKQNVADSSPTIAMSETAIASVATVAKINSGFNAQTMANSRSQGLMDKLDELLKAEQQNKHATIGLKSKTAEVAFKHGQSSAAELINAGVAGRDQAIAMGATSIGLSGVGGIVQYRGASKAIKAQKVHAGKASSLTQQANKYEAKAASTLNSNTLAAKNDAAILRQTALFKREEAAKQSLEADRLSQQANRQQAYGNLIAGNAGGMGQLTSAQYQVVQAQHQSESQLRATDQQVNNARAEAEERQAQNDQQIIQQLLQQLTQIAQERNNTVSSMIRS